MEKIIFSVVAVLLLQTSQAQTSTDATPASATANSASAGPFEVIDVSGQVAGEPMLTQSDARDSWTKACQEWKKETKGLNKNNEILGINCNSPTCNTVDIAKTECVSTGTYKVKTAGVRVNNSTIAPAMPEPPTLAELPPNHEIAMPPPPMIVEAVPPPRVGFIWVGGYWGWGGTRHVWVPGRWVVEQPGYYWVHEGWERHGQGWRFRSGGWHSR
jgi:hypothetical protein